MFAEVNVERKSVPSEVFGSIKAVQDEEEED